jgi:Ca2+-binding EF-hand superfamily protein
MSPRKRDQDSPVPSITLQITQKTADHFLRTSDALKEDLRRLIQSKESSLSSSPSSTTTTPIFEDVYRAMLYSQQEDVKTFLQRLRAASLSTNEEKVAALLFHESPMYEKLGYCLGAVRANKSDDDEPQSKADFVSLFHGILSGIMCCCEMENKSEFVVEGKPERAEADGAPQTKRTKTEDMGSESTVPVTAHLSSSISSSEGKDIRDVQSPSFDSTIATLHDEEQPEGVKKEIAEVANYAADQLLQYSQGTSVEDITVEDLQEWYQKSGSMVVPWMELLSLSQWQSASSRNTGAVPKADTDDNNSKGSDVCNKENETNDKDVSQQEASSSTTGSSSMGLTSSTTAKEMETKSAFVPPPSRSVPQADNEISRSESAETSPGSLINEDSTSRTLVSFDFSGSGSPDPFCINISEDNLTALRHFVQRTGLMHCHAPEICKRLLRLATHRAFGDEALLTLQRETWVNSMDRLIGRDAWEQLTTTERASFAGCLADLFACYEGNKSFLRSDEVDLQEFSVGFCFFCAGNKSTKLATGFEMLDDKRKSSLSQEELLRYLNSYLTMLVAMSLMKPIEQRNKPTKLTEEKRSRLRQAVECGSRWTLGHFVKYVGNNDFEARKDSYSFEKFASWYSSGGYEVAPWLELLDLTKIFSLLSANPALGMDVHGAHPVQKSYPRDRVSSLRRHHSSRRGPIAESLFTFPMASQTSLTVLKEDAVYVRSVVEDLGLLSMNPDDLWASLSSAVRQKQKGQAGAVYVSMSTFVESMETVCRQSRARISPATGELLSNFFQCFDLDNNNHVALDELMGGLTLLCGGKKSHKLAFAFGVFDTRPRGHDKKLPEGMSHSLSGEDLFLFLRSILIVTFSCCRQSLDMTDGMVARCIADTANMICNDVMRHQWEQRGKDRLNFDEFGQWYNDGGYERAPWLELLDLRKWVLVEDLSVEYKRPTSQLPLRHNPPQRNVHSVPPPPPEDALDADFFENTIMPMDSVSLTLFITLIFI